jgi:hypothetical protein
MRLSITQFHPKALGISALVCGMCALTFSLTSCNGSGGAVTSDTGSSGTSGSVGNSSSVGTQQGSTTTGGQGSGTGSYGQNTGSGYQPANTNYYGNNDPYVPPAAPANDDPVNTGPGVGPGGDNSVGSP